MPDWNVQPEKHLRSERLYSVRAGAQIALFQGVRFGTEALWNPSTESAETIKGGQVMTYKPTRILVPTDFSDASDRALSFAKAIAGQFDAEIHLLHVRVVLDDPNVDSEILDEVERILTATESVTRQALEREGTDGRPRIHTHMKRGVIPAEVIIDAIEEFACDLVIMGTHGRRGFKRLLTGSVAREVVHKSPVPVLTTRAETDGQFPPRRILIPVDFSKTCLGAVQWAGAVAPVLDAEITLLHVIQPLVYPQCYLADATPDQLREELVRRCQETLRKTAREHLTDVKCEVVVIEGHVARNIARYALEHNQDMVVAATRGLSGVAHTLLGSVAERLVTCAQVPVLTVR